MRKIAEQASTTAPTPDDDGADATKPPTHSDEQEALFAEQDRQLQQKRASQLIQPVERTEDNCPHNRLIGGSCHDCGYDDGTGPQPSADYNNGH